MGKLDAYPNERSFLQPMRDGSGSVTGYRVVGNAPREIADRSVEVFDDFLLGLTQPPWVVTANNAGAGWDPVLSFGAAALTGLRGQGVARGNTGTTAIGQAQFCSYQSMRMGTSCRLRGGFRLTTHELSTGAEEYVLRAGFSDSPLYQAAVGNRAMFIYDRATNGEFWRCEYWAGGALTTVVSTKTRAANAFQVLQIDLAEQGDLCTFHIDGTLCAEIQCAAPWDDCCFFGAGIEKTVGGTSRSILVDWAQLLLDGSADR